MHNTTMPDTIKAINNLYLYKTCCYQEAQRQTWIDFILFIYTLQTLVQNIICSFNALMYVIMRCYLVETIFYSVSKENINILFHHSCQPIKRIFIYYLTHKPYQSITIYPDKPSLHSIFIPHTRMTSYHSVFVWVMHF